METPMEDEDPELAMAIQMSLEQPHAGVQIDQIPQSMREEIAVEELRKQEGMFEPYQSSKCPEETGFVIQLSGLDWSLTQEQISDFLEGRNMGGAAGVAILKNERGKPSGIATARYAKEEELERAIKLYNKKMLGKRYVVVERFINTDAKGHAAKTNRTPEASNSQEFFVKLNGLDWSLTPEQICNFLEDCKVVGGSAGVCIEMNERGKPSGSATVKLETAADVEKAMKYYHKKMLGKRYVVIEQIGSPTKPVSAKATDKTRKVEEPNERKFRVKISNLSRQMNEATISEFLSKSGVTVMQANIVMLFNDKGKPSGEAIVKLTGEEELKTVLQLNEQSLGNRSISVCQVENQKI